MNPPSGDSSTALKDGRLLSEHRKAFKHMSESETKFITEGIMLHRDIVSSQRQRMRAERAERYDEEKKTDREKKTMRKKQTPSVWGIQFIYHS